MFSELPGISLWLHDGGTIVMTRVLIALLIVAGSVTPAASSNKIQCFFVDEACVKALAAQVDLLNVEMQTLRLEIKTLRMEMATRQLQLR
jgi:outer membrane murein-binding lipoprotein Lpp